MSTLPPNQGPDPAGELADWVRDKLPKLLGGIGEGLCVLGLAAGRVADKLADNLKPRGK